MASGGAGGRPQGCSGEGRVDETSGGRFWGTVEPSGKLVDGRGVNDTLVACRCFTSTEMVVSDDSLVPFIWFS